MTKTYVPLAINSISLLAVAIVESSTARFSDVKAQEYEISEIIVVSSTTPASEGYIVFVEGFFTPLVLA